MAVPTQFAFRTSKGIGITDAAPVYESLPGFQRPEGNLRCCMYSPDGRYFAWASTEKVTIIDASVGHVITSLPADNVYELGFSPLGTYIITWQRPSKTESGDATKNLTVWRVVTSDNGEEITTEDNIVGRFVQKNQTGWNLQYTQDENYCARVVTNEVQFYESGNLSNVWNKLRVEGVQDFAISPGETNSVAVFIPEKKGLPAAVKIFNVPHFSAPVSQKTFFKGDKVQLKWNQHGTSLIVLAQTEVDRSGKSYYGETTLYLLSANGGFDSRIDLDKEGPIHDVTWSPNSKEFGVVYGYMPAKTTIFNNKAVATHNFALGPRNTILFSPTGRFVLVAGFGNLAGQIDVYDLEKDFLKICTIQASNASVCDWSPDGKYLLTATTSPRLRVDNGVRIWHVGGGLMYNEDMTELYHVTWRPQSSDAHQIPSRDPLNPVPEPHPSALAYLGTVKTPSKPAGAYRPPGARGTTTPLAFMREDQGGAAYVSNGSMSLGGSSAANFGKPRKRDVPGAEAATADSSSTVPGAAAADGGDEQLSKAALKNKKKREAKKAKEAAERASGLAPGPDGMAPPGSPSPASGRRSPERRGNRERNRSRTNSELRPRSQNRRDGQQRGSSQHRRGGGEGKESGERGERGERGGHGRGHGRGHNHSQSHGQAHHGGGHHGLPDRTPTGPRANGTAAPPQPHALNTAAAITAANIAMTGSAPDLTVTTPGGGLGGATPNSAGAGGGTPQEKKVRALTKKLRAIDDLKMRRAGGEKLEATQIKKMDTEEAVRRELEGLGWREE